MKKLITAVVCLCLLASIAITWSPPPPPQWCPKYECQQLWNSLNGFKDDFYGKYGTDSWNKNMLLNAIDEGYIDVSDICDLINSTEMTAEQFGDFLVYYQEYLGYDDLIVFNSIWDYCKECKIRDLESYISENEGKWSEDIVGGGGISSETASSLIQNALITFVGDIGYQELSDRMTIIHDFLILKFGKEYCDYEGWRLINEMNYTETECGGTIYYAPKDGGDGMIGITPLS